MTAPDPRVGEIEALIEGLTDLCPEHLRQSIRHVQRNCDIDCNEHEDEASWDDCKQPDRYDGARMAKALASIPYLLAELRDREGKLARVEGLHKSTPDWDHSTADLCSECHDTYPCSTIKALRAAVAADGGGDRG